MSDGFVYRVPRADVARLHAIVTQVVGTTGYTFGGASVWDFVSSKGRGNLRPIMPFTPADVLDVSGDFGHAFSQQAEVRWKRLDKISYDVLILSEQPQAINGATEIVVEWHDPDTKQPVKGAWQTSESDKLAIVQAEDRPGIRYVTYHAPNGAAQIVRYKGVT